MLRARAVHRAFSGAIALAWPMGFRPAFLLAALASSPSAPALAQQQDQPQQPVFTLPRDQAQPSGPSQRQGPELDVYRDPVPGTAQRPAVAPTVQVPPPVILPPAAEAPQQRQAPAPRQAAARRPAPEPAPPQAQDPAGESGTQGRAAPSIQPDAPVASDPQPIPADTAPPPAPAEETRLAPGTPFPWLWVVGGGVLLLLAASTMWVRRHKHEPEKAKPRSKAVVTQPPAPARPVPRPGPPPATSDKPQLELFLEVSSARYSLMGVTIAYALTLHNRGTQPMHDIVVRALLANAGEGQQAALRQFFAGESGMPVHSVVKLAPGESHRLTNELRLATQEIAPVQMSGRALLIPIAAFDAHFRWGEGESLNAGRSGGTFIVGQEQEPPTDRLAPFRLDQGPRQYRRPAARATGTLAPA